MGRRFRRRSGLTRRGGAMLLVGGLLATSAFPAQAADIYVSPGPDGGLRYSSQPLDESYSLLFSDRSSPADAPGNSKLELSQREIGKRRELEQMIDAIARRHGMPADLVQAVVAVESGFNPHALSPKGARGAMQLMPATARQYGLHTSHQMESAAQNIEAGVLHLKSLLARHHGNVALALAAYNAGSGAVARHGERIPPYSETMLYVPAVLSRTTPTQP